MASYFFGFRVRSLAITGAACIAAACSGKESEPGPNTGLSSGASAETSSEPALPGESDPPASNEAAGGSPGGASPAGGEGGGGGAATGGAGGVTTGGAGGAAAGGAGGAATGGASGAATGGTAATPVETVPGNFAMRCESDVDCNDGLNCVLEDAPIFGGGVPGGYCGQGCVPAEMDSCTKLGSDAACLSTGAETPDPGDDASACLQTCNLGAQKKCHGRDDFVCQEVAVAGLPADGVCFPLCYSDDQCRGGFCDRETGTCTTEKPEGLADGKECIVPASGEVEPCLGFCADVSAAGIGAPGLCASTCRLPEMPGVADPCDPVGRTTACLPLSALAGPGDSAACQPLCDTDADCILGWVCAPFPAGQALLERTGRCEPPAAL